MDAPARSDVAPRTWVVSARSAAFSESTNFSNVSSFGQFRFGLFAGVEPKIRDVGYVDGITKGGAYVAVDAAHGRRHVLGWVLIRNEELTERSIVIFNNFIPVKRKFFLYQALEYDLEGPAGLGDTELGYFFTNLRYAPVQSIEFQGTYHRGRSIDARSITDDVLDGRPVDPERLQRTCCSSPDRFRVNAQTVATGAGLGRLRPRPQQLGTTSGPTAPTSDFHSTTSQRSGSTFPPAPRGSTALDREYDSTWVIAREDPRPAGLPVARLSDFALGFFQYTTAAAARSRYGRRVSGTHCRMNANISRTFSLLVVGELTDHDDYEEVRALTGLTIRF